MLRHLRRNPAFHAVVTALLGLGIGANTLVFSLINELLLKPLPVRDPRNLYLLERISPRNVRPDPYFRERHLRDVVRKSPLVAAAVAEQTADQGAVVPLRRNGTTRLVMAQIVSSNYFSELGVRAFAGRLLDESDAMPGAATAAVLSYQFWQSEFAGDPAAIGQTIRLKNTPCMIVGILPRQFHSSDVDRAPDVRLPVTAAAPLFGSIDKITSQILIRLASGTSPQRGAASLEPGLRAVDEAHDREVDPKDLLPETWTGVLEPIERGVSRVRTQFAEALWLLLGGVGLLLLAVCANVSGLLIAKSGDRQRELTIRVAVGAGRGDILRQLLGENLALAVPGAMLGAAFAWMLTPEVVRLLPAVRDFGQFASPQLLVVTPDLRVLLFGTGVTLFCVLASGLFPAWRSSNVDLACRLKRFSRTASIAPVALQAAFCMVLVSAAGLMLRSYWKLNRLDAGFDRDHVIEFTLDPGDAGYTKAQSGALYRELRARVGALPGVRSAAWAMRGVMRGVGVKTTVAPVGVVLPKSTFLNTSLNDVTPGYFETMGMGMTAGRDLRLDDAGAQPKPVVVNQAFVTLFFPRRNPLGKLLVQGTDGTRPPAWVIVGVVPTAKYRSMREVDPPTLYGALDESKGSDWQLVLYLRSHGAPSALAGAVRKTLMDLDPGVPLIETATLDSEIRTSLWQERLVAILSAFFGLTSVGLAAIGLYGALALSVAQRRRELGIRVAVGAQLRHLVQTVCTPMAAGVACGMLAGLAGAMWLLRLTRALLFGVAPFDTASFLGAMVVVLVCSVAAAALPARRAARVDPATALREQ